MSNSSYESKVPPKQQDKIQTRQTTLESSYRNPAQRRHSQTPPKNPMAYLNNTIYNPSLPTFEDMGGEKSEFFDQKIKKKTSVSNNGTANRKGSNNNNLMGGISANKRKEDGLELEIIEMKKKVPKIEEESGDQGFFVFGC